MCWENEGGWVELNRGVRTARKAHLCAEGHTINPGERYHWAVGKWEGDFSTWKACEPCIAAAQALGAACRLYDRWSDNPPLGTLYESYVEHLVGGELPLDVVPPEVVAGLWEHAERLGIERSLYEEVAP
jgi:hypothetical protein